MLAEFQKQHPYECLNNIVLLQPCHLLQGPLLFDIANLDMPSLTDHNTVKGIPEFIKECKKSIEKIIDARLQEHLRIRNLLGLYDKKDDKNKTFPLIAKSLAPSGLVFNVICYNTICLYEI